MRRHRHIGWTSREFFYRRTRALVSAGAAAAAAAGTAAVLLLSVTVAAAPPALAAVTSALSRAAAESFRMNLIVTQHNTVPDQGPVLQSPLHITGKLDLKRNLGEEMLSNGWQTLITGQKAYTKLPAAQAAKMGMDKPWGEEALADTEPVGFHNVVVVVDLRCYGWAGDSHAAR